MVLASNLLLSKTFSAAARPTRGDSEWVSVRGVRMMRWNCRAKECWEKELKREEVE
jgi:hypothetical protein